MRTGPRPKGRHRRGTPLRRTVAAAQLDGQRQLFDDRVERLLALLAQQAKRVTS